MYTLSLSLLAVPSRACLRTLSILEKENENKNGRFVLLLHSLFPTSRVNGLVQVRLGQGAR